MESNINKIKKILSFGFENAGNLFVLKIAGLGLNYFVLLLILHYYGFKGNGEYAVILELARGLKVFVVFGLDYLIVKEINSNSKNKRNELLSLFFVFICSNLIFLSIFFGIRQLIEINIDIFFWTLFMAFWRFLSHYHRGRDNMLAYGFFEFVIFQFLALLSIILSRLFFLNTAFETIINWLNIIAISICSIVFFSKIFAGISVNDLLNLFSTTLFNLFKVYKKGVYFVLTNSTNILSVSILYVIIKNNYTSEILGVYDTVLKFAMIVSLPLIAMSGKVMTLAAKYFNDNNFIELKKYINKTTQMLIIISTIISFGVILFYAIYSEFFNFELKAYWGLFILLVVAQLINNWTGPVGVILQVTNNEKVFNKITIFSGIYLILSTYFLAKYFNIYIIALNMIVYLLIINILSLKVQKEKLGINPHNTIIKKYDQSRTKNK